MLFIGNLFWIAAVSALAVGESTVETRGLLTPNPAYTLKTDPVGGPHGTAFNDFHHVDAANGGKRIHSITLGPCNDVDHVTYMGLTFADAAGHHLEVEHHGAMDPHAPVLSLDLSDRRHRITQVQVSTWKQKVGLKHKTRVGWLKIVSGKGTITCGANKSGEEISWWQPPAGSSLSFFAGSAGDAIDSLQAYFIKDSDY